MGAAMARARAILARSERGAEELAEAEAEPEALASPSIGAQPVAVKASREAAKAAVKDWRIFILSLHAGAMFMGHGK